MRALSIHIKMSKGGSWAYYPIRGVSRIVYIKCIALKVICTISRAVSLSIAELTILFFIHRQYSFQAISVEESAYNREGGYDYIVVLIDFIEKKTNRQRACEKRKYKIYPDHFSVEIKTRSWVFCFHIHGGKSLLKKPEGCLLLPSLLTQLYDIGHEKTSGNTRISSDSLNRKRKTKHPLVVGGSYLSSCTHRRKRCHY